MQAIAEREEQLAKRRVDLATERVLAEAKWKEEARLGELFGSCFSPEVAMHVKSPQLARIAAFIQNEQEIRRLASASSNSSSSSTHS